MPELDEKKEDGVGEAKLQDVKEEAKEKKTNIWQDLLRKSTRQMKDSTSTLVVVGDRKNGKSKLLEKLADRKSASESKQYILDYSYVEVKNKQNPDKEETLAYMNVWQLDEPLHAPSLQMLINSARSGLDRTVYMITLNMAETWSVLAQLKKWLKTLSEVNEHCMASLTQEQQEALKARVSRHMQFYVDHSVKEKTSEHILITEEEKAKVKLDASRPPINLGVPIIVVGCRTDYVVRKLLKEGPGAEEKFDYLTRKLREACLEYGATLIYTSARHALNVEVLQDYIFHRLYNFGLTHPAKVVGSCEDYGVYIPSGHDSHDLLNAVELPKSGIATATPLGEVFPDLAAKQKEREQRNKVVVEAMENDKFFELLLKQQQDGPPQKGERKARTDYSSAMSAASAATAGGAVASPAVGAVKDDKASSRQSIDPKNAAVYKTFFQKLLKGAGKPESGGAAPAAGASASSGDAAPEKRSRSGTRTRSRSGKPGSRKGAKKVT